MPDATPLDAIKHAHPADAINDLLSRRWSPRAFTAQPVSDEQLRSIFTAGAWAPSSNNEQPWRFLVGRKGDETYKKIFDSLVSFNQLWNANTPVLIASFGKKTFSKDGSTNGYALHDTGAASQNMAVQATALGLHMHGMGGFDRETLRAFFGVPSDFEVGACWALGYLGDPASLPENFRNLETAPRSRKALNEIVFSDWEKPAKL